MINENTLQSISLFASLPPQVITEITRHAKSHYYKKGTLIFDSHEANQSFVYVLKGWIKLFRESTDGAEVIVDILNEQHFAGENFLFNGEQETYSCEAISDVEIITIPTHILRQLVEENHQLTLNFFKYTLQKQQKLTIEMENLSIRNASQRLGCFLLRLCSLKKNKDIAIHLPYDKSLLASRLGMRAETFSRALSKICHDCGIQSDGDALHIPNASELIQYVCQYCSQTYPCKYIMG